MVQVFVCTYGLCIIVHCEWLVQVSSSSLGRTRDASVLRRVTWQGFSVLRRLTWVLASWMRCARVHPWGAYDSSSSANPIHSAWGPVRDLLGACLGSDAFDSIHVILLFDGVVGILLFDGFST